eukprot:352386-Chlamydomonas_euryale.AAC.8
MQISCGPAPLLALCMPVESGAGTYFAAAGAEEGGRCVLRPTIGPGVVARTCHARSYAGGVPPELACASHIKRAALPGCRTAATATIRAGQPSSAGRNRNRACRASSGAPPPLRFLRRDPSAATRGPRRRRRCSVQPSIRTALAWAPMQSVVGAPPRKHNLVRPPRPLLRHDTGDAGPPSGSPNAHPGPGSCADKGETHWPRVRVLARIARRSHCCACCGSGRPPSGPTGFSALRRRRCHTPLNFPADPTQLALYKPTPCSYGTRRHARADLEYVQARCQANPPALATRIAPHRRGRKRCGTARPGRRGDDFQLVETDCNHAATAALAAARAVSQATHAAVAAAPIVRRAFLLASLCRSPARRRAARPAPLSLAPGTQHRVHAALRRAAENAPGAYCCCCGGGGGSDGGRRRAPAPVPGCAIGAEVVRRRAPPAPASDPRCLSGVSAATALMAGNDRRDSDRRGGIRGGPKRRSARGACCAAAGACGAGRREPAPTRPRCRPPASASPSSAQLPSPGQTVRGSLSRASSLNRDSLGFRLRAHPHMQGVQDASEGG